MGGLSGQGKSDLFFLRKIDAELSTEILSIKIEEMKVFYNTFKFVHMQNRSQNRAK